MPEMTDAMYCHQQICVPPTFPYLLRQYAKAAIRSQPNDLLRWSCSYFRSLALGLRPPTKDRLEYPIPRTHYGLTPGWLKTLLMQFAGYNTVSWPQLYDRWRGACLQVQGLQEILLIGEFNDPKNIPWHKFVATAAGHLTTNLTNTMILICELFTEEPEGGSASIPYSKFADLYKFLAGLEGCEEREVANFWFTESNLDLSKFIPVEEKESAQLESPYIETIATITMGEEETIEHDFSDLEKYLKTIAASGSLEEEEGSPLIKEMSSVVSEELVTEPSTAPEPACYIILEPEDGKICDELHSKGPSSSSGTSSEPSIAVAAAAATDMEEDVEELEEETIPIEISKIESISSSTSASEESQVKFILRPIPGIGGIVKEEVVNLVLKFLQEVSFKQNGMVMPRNVKHFLCPPLEECIR